MTAWFTPGVVIAAPRRTMTTMARVNRIRRRSSGILTVLRNAETIAQPLWLVFPRLLLRGGFRRRFFLRRRLLLRLRPGRRFGFRGRGLFRIARSLRRRFRPQRHCPASLLNFLARGGTDLIGLNREGVLQF